MNYKLSHQVNTIENKYKMRIFTIKTKSVGMKDNSIERIITWGSRARLPAGVGNFSLRQRVQNGSGAHPVSYPMATRGYFPGGKAAEA